REVHIEPAAARAIRLDTLDDATGVAAGNGPVDLAAILIVDALAHRDAEGTLQGAFARACRRPRAIDDIAEVLPIVHAGQDEVSRVVLEQKCHARDDAIGGRAVRNGEHTRTPL